MTLASWRKKYIPRADHDPWRWAARKNPGEHDEMGNPSVMSSTLSEYSGSVHVRCCPESFAKESMTYTKSMTAREHGRKQHTIQQKRMCRPKGSARLIASNLRNLSSRPLRLETATHAVRVGLRVTDYQRKHVDSLRSQTNVSVDTKRSTIALSNWSSIHQSQKKKKQHLMRTG